MFVSVDGEGAKIDARGKLSATGDRMALVTLSFGREDGTSGTWDGKNAKDALHWLRENVTGEYTDAAGKVWRQIPVAFHFTWDMSVISTYFDPTRMTLVHKSTAKETNLICDTNHRAGDPECGKAYHRRSVDDINAVITDGGEGDVCAWDPVSKLAITATPKRRFYAEYRPNGDQFRERGKTTDIHDTGSAFVGGLLMVIDKWKPELSADQIAIIEWGKKHRKDGTFTYENLPMIAAYSEAECVAHARVCRQLIIAIKQAAGFAMKPGKLYGSGSVAQVAFEHHKVATGKETAPGDAIVQKIKTDHPTYGLTIDPALTDYQRVQEFRAKLIEHESGSPEWLAIIRAERAVKLTVNDARHITIDDLAWLDYFGGLIETPVVGMVRGHVDELDLNSAYPAAMIHLPCMRAGHGEWKQTKRAVSLPAHTVGHVLASWAVDTPSTAPFLVRDADSRVYAPLTGQRIWVTLPEYQAAIRQFPGQIVSHQTAWWEASCDCPPPFEWIGALYLERLKLKDRMGELKRAGQKDSPEWQALKCREEAIKLVINSCYGKLAQRRPQLGRYTNLHYAAMITGETRSSVRIETWAREAERGLPVYQHTDSVLSVGGKPEDGGTELGAWGLEDKATTNFVIVQPGLAAATGDKHIPECGSRTHCTKDDECECECHDGKVATRGVSKDDFEAAIRAWAKTTDFTRHPETWPPIHIEQDRMHSRRLAVFQGHPERAGAFLPAPMDITVGSTPKRNIAAAYPVKGMPEAWIVPPLTVVARPVRDPETIRLYQKTLLIMQMRGEFDIESSRSPFTGELDFATEDEE
jgi:hypothetical protein